METLSWVKDEASVWTEVSVIKKLDGGKVQIKRGGTVQEVRPGASCSTIMSYNAFKTESSVVHALCWKLFPFPCLCPMMPSGH